MKYLFAVLSFIFLAIISGCSTVTQTLYLQNMQVSGPVANTPLNITTRDKKDTFTFSARFSVNDNQKINGRVEGHSNVDPLGSYAVDTVFNNNGTWYYKPSDKNVRPYEGSNLEWNLPNYSAAVSVDYSPGENLSLNLGLNYAVQNQASYSGGNAGIGFFSVKGNSAVRLDAGVIWQEMSYVASTVMVTTDKPFSGPSTTTVDFFKDRNRSTNWNPYVSLTYNSISETALVNYFISAGFFSQTLFDFTPSSPNPEYYPFAFTVIRNDQRGESTASFFHITPGIFFNMTDNSKILFGVRILKETQIEDASKSLFVLPVLQLDMNF